MRIVKLFIAVAMIVIVAWLLFFMRDEDTEQVAELAQRQERRAQQATEPKSTEVDLDELAAKGQGMRVPESMVISPDPSGFWFVGKEGVKVGAELPFSPGQLPKPIPDLEPTHKNPGFLGAQACKSCHPKTFESFSKTSHHLTSQPATPEAIRGSLESGENVMKTSHPSVEYEMRTRDGIGLQRVSFLDWKFDVPMHVITGSSKMAQTYLYWHGDELYQANVTYLTSKDAWINSPGFLDGDAAYARPIGDRCLECHTTYVDYRGAPNHYTPDTLIFGISCERCHGPGQEHVEYHAANPDDKTSKFVTVPSDLPREKELHVCSQCHSGATELLGEAYQFRPGDELNDHYEPPEEQLGNSVHTSNQLARMKQSKCFQGSEMTCIDCHNPHQFERGNLKLFSERCLVCHDSEHCGESQRVGERISDDCVSCHMPGGTGELRLDSADGSVFPEMTDHYIRIDRDATNEFYERLGLSPKKK